MRQRRNQPRHPLRIAVRIRENNFLCVSSCSFRGTLRLRLHRPRTDAATGAAGQTRCAKAELFAGYAYQRSISRIQFTQHRNLSGEPFSHRLHDRSIGITADVTTSPAPTCPDGFDIVR